MMWATNAAVLADGVVTLARGEEGEPSGVVLLDEDERLVQLLNRDRAVAVALRILDLVTQIEAPHTLRRDPNVDRILADIEN